MQVLMGGSGSTGSSLLKNILNRNEEIFAGVETSLFCKRELFYNWSQNKSRIQKRKVYGLRNSGFLIFNGIDLLEEGYSLTEKEITDLIGQSSTFSSFSNHFFLQNQKAEIWIEKTPGNCVNFDLFLKDFPASQVIHMVRNPYDTIASLVGRGFSTWYATGIYLCNTACGLRTRQHQNAHQVSYEDLVQKPEATVFQVCEFLGVPFSKDMLESKGEQIANSKIGNWKYDETAKVQKGSVGRFETLAPDLQEEIITAVQLARIKKKYAHQLSIQHYTIREICQTLNYDYKAAPMTKHTIRKLKRQRRKNIWERIRRGHPSGLDYPLKIKRPK